MVITPGQLTGNTLQSYGGYGQDILAHQPSAVR